MDCVREKNYTQSGVKDPNRTITCSNCRHGIGVPNGKPIWRCDWRCRVWSKMGGRTRKATKISKVLTGRIPHGDEPYRRCLEL